MKAYLSVIPILLAITTSSVHADKVSLDACLKEAMMQIVDNVLENIKAPQTALQDAMHSHELDRRRCHRTSLCYVAEGGTSYKKEFENCMALAEAMDDAQHK